MFKADVVCRILLLGRRELFKADILSGILRRKELFKADILNRRELFKAGILSRI